MITSKQFRQLVNESRKFNIFKALKLENYEIRHSNFLAWLLNPKESHGLNDCFLKLFLEKISDVKEDFPFQEIYFKSLADAKINTEYGINCEGTSKKQSNKKDKEKNHRIDVLIEHDDFIIVIENKRLSNEHNDQLEDTKEWLDTKYPDTEQSCAKTNEKIKNKTDKICILLTPEGWKEKDCKGWINITYSQISECLSVILKCYSDSITPRVQDALTQYQYIIEGENVDNIKDESIAALEKEHKEALKLIQDKNQKLTLETTDFVKHIQQEYSDIIELLPQIGYFDDFVTEMGKDDWEYFGPYKREDEISYLFLPSNLYKIDSENEFIVSFKLHHDTKTNKVWWDFYLYPIKPDNNEDIREQIKDTLKKYFEEYFNEDKSNILKELKTARFKNSKSYTCFLRKNIEDKNIDWKKIARDIKKDPFVQAVQAIKLENLQIPLNINE